MCAKRVHIVKFQANSHVTRLDCCAGRAQHDLRTVNAFGAAETWTRPKCGQGGAVESIISGTFLSMWCRGHHRTSVGTPVLITAKALPAWLCYVEGHHGDTHLPEADLRGSVYRAYKRSVSIDRIVHLPTGS
jgi:hypothetical protein